MNDIIRTILLILSCPFSTSSIQDTEYAASRCPCRNDVWLVRARQSTVPLRGTASCPPCALTPRRCSHPSGSGTGTTGICLAGGLLSALRRKVKGHIDQCTLTFTVLFKRNSIVPTSGDRFLLPTKEETIPHWGQVVQWPKNIQESIVLAAVTFLLRLLTVNRRQ